MPLIHDVDHCRNSLATQLHIHHFLAVKIRIALVAVKRLLILWLDFPQKYRHGASLQRLHCGHGTPAPAPEQQLIALDLTGANHFGCGAAPGHLRQV